MTLKETKQLLTMIWSLFPNAPKLTREDKEAMAFAWLAMLWEYSLQDVWKATQVAMSIEQRFVPTAPEVLKHCYKSYNSDGFLKKEQIEVIDRIDLSITATVNRRTRLSFFQAHPPESDEEKAEYEKLKKEIRECEIAEKWLDDAWEASRNAYDRGEKEKLAEEGTLPQLRMMALI